ncbi:uncharacterized protein LOC134830744 [Culicoides brevitarsis]|uniref:uncharacterized protein LOC134830744 n=1 Tax=Culicoides brevitarsis TaxID=469753 RepID=UPI00307B4CDD
MQSSEAMAAPEHQPGSSKSVFGVSSVESFGTIPENGLTFEKSESCDIEKRQGFPFQVSYDSIEIKKDPRERQNCQFFTEPAVEHEHLITVNEYGEPYVLPYVIVDNQNDSNDEETPENFVNCENVMQYFEIIDSSYENLNERRAGEAPSEPIFALVSVDSHENHQETLQDTQIPPSATSLNISRAPILCPISTCNKLEFKSLIVKHIQTDHPRVLLKIISSGAEKSHLWDTRIDKKNIRKCHVVYLLRDRIRDLGSTEFRNYLPILVMTTKFKASSIFGENEIKSREQSHFMIWLTGLAIEELPVHYTLTLCSNKLPNSSRKIVFSNEIYSWRQDQSTRALYESGNALILTHQQFMQLSHDGTELIRVKICIN